MHRPTLGNTYRRLGKPDEMFRVVAHDKPSTTVKINEGSYQIGNKVIEYVGGVSPIISPPISGTEWVIIGISNIGDLSEVNLIRGGATNSSNPPFPNIPKNILLLAGISLSSSDTVITNDMIFDLRPQYLVPDSPVSHNELTGRTNNDAHNINSITGLQTVLDSKLNTDSFNSILQSQLAQKADIDGTINPDFILNKDQSGNPTQNVTLMVERGGEPNTGFRWNEGIDEWEITNNGTTWISITNLINTLVSANETTKGIVKLSVAPNNTNEPVAIGANDPRMLTSGDKLLVMNHINVTSGDPHGVLGLLTAANLPAHNHTANQGGALGANTISGVQLQDNSVENRHLATSLQNKYVDREVNCTISATHVIQPNVPSPPFALGSNAELQLVHGLNADVVDGKHANEFASANHNHTLTSLSEKSYTSLTNKPTHSQIENDEPEKHRAINDLITSTTELWSSSKVDTTVTERINNLVNGAGNALNQLNEIGTALNNDPNFAATMTTMLGNKVDKVSTPVSGNFASLNAQGNIVDSTKKSADFEPANINIQGHISSLLNPHQVTKTQVGLGNVIDGKQILEADRTNTVIDSQTLVPSCSAIISYSTKEHVGLGNVINEKQLVETQKTNTITNDANLVPSCSAVITYANKVNVGLGNVINEKQLVETLRVAVLNNDPNQVPSCLAVTNALTKENVGLENVLNGEQLLKSNKVDVISNDSNLIPSCPAIIAYTTKATIGLGNVTNDAQLKVANFVTTLVDDDTKIASSKATLDHFTKANVGLSNVTNDVQLKAADLVITVTNTDTKIPSSGAIYRFVTKNTIGLENVTNDAQLKAADLVTTLISDDTKIPSSKATLDHFTKANVGLSNVTNDVQLKAADLVTTIVDNDTKVPSSKAVLTLVTDTIVPAFGSTGNRPTGKTTGFMYFDTTLGHPIWYNGIAWVDVLGSPA